MKNAPNFEAWNQALLAQYAIEQYQENIRLREALEQVRLEKSSQASEPQGGTHATPRRHQCRGHWRNCKSGKRVWVKDCWKGDASKGTVFKDYKAATNEPVAA